MKDANFDILKQEARQHIVDRANQTDAKRFMDFYGTGEMFRYWRKHTNIPLLSIDNDPALKPQLTGRSKRLMSFEELCSSEIRDKYKFDYLWLDYCGTYCNRVIEHINMLKNITKDKGTIAFTFMRERENFVPKGTLGSVIEKIIIASVKEELQKHFKNVKQTYRLHYMSYLVKDGQIRKKKSGTPMFFIEFEWDGIR